MTDSDKIEHFPLEILPEIQANPGGYRLLERVPFSDYDEESNYPVVLGPEAPDEKSLIILDTETTGLELDSAQIIELGMVKVKYSIHEARITRIVSVYDAFEQPEEPIPELITRITGIDNSMVEGRHFDEARVMKYFQDSPLVVAHNATMDRGFVEKRFSPLFASMNLRLPWACTVNDVDWHRLFPGIASRKQEYLLNQRGYFYDAHRAINDCLALLWLLHTTPGVMVSLLQNARRRNLALRVGAGGNTWNHRDAFRDFGYRYVRFRNAWEKICQDQNEVNRELEMLRGQMLIPDAQIQVSVLDAYTRYRDKLEALGR
ncbi:3'-5' exonuclease [Succinimonas amylolytica]|uniref:3'-5' exonuclease n=1 Tax=Succinimonas amylolytica TaxID=83769 RepID=UPI0003618DD4|nr:3'-5' exonuclease [Succinimonas amylolytica]